MERFRTLRLVLLGAVLSGLNACGSGGSGGVNIVDNTPPAVIATDPPAGAVGVQLTDPIVVTFSEPIAPGSVNANSFVITRTGLAVTGGNRTVSGRTVRFSPDAGTFLKPERYEATLTTGITDIAGNALAAPFSFSFTISTDEWTRTSDAGAPAARTQHRAVWTGSEMIVWGGIDSSGLLNTGARFNPGSPDATAWTATADSAMENVPPARVDHTLVWTGDEMIVWGGDEGRLQPTNTGGRYVPAADTWSAGTSTTPPPAAGILPRSLHTAVWTGTEMIAWGGATNLGRTNTGGRFNPSTGSWTPTNTSGAPVARSEHTAVWTGSEMIVWGGRDTGDLLLASGGRYRPVMNNWSAVSTVDAPSPRVGHTAIWTGTEMIVWGGDDGLLKKDGARYNPVTNTWRPISNIDAPSVRSDHTAVWTGTEMIVWGGSAADNSGGAYNPARDEWRTIASAPSARTGHTAVWTGTEMIVWGGVEGGGRIVATGARYSP